MDVRYTGIFLMCGGSYAAFNVVRALIASTIPRTRTKRAIVYGLYFFPTKDSPQCRPGVSILSCFAAGKYLVGNLPN
ncbi:hypothetical protein BDV29DRAFT_177273 [Aspergillus leporis]|uniref:Uncharacterized protein n=1 Tax=Aspergillus leporis TaxID=41062 RepID=A0A5N5WZH8_9EURO|nr:hypothetical protein BDV29DRAFT_177273 [Aspergillus leporis]